VPFGNPPYKATGEVPGVTYDRAMLATGGWSQTGLSTMVLALYAVPYLMRARTLARHGRPVPPWRVGCFAAGLLLLALAVSPPVDVAADRRLTVHMAEHLAIGDVAPLLLVLGLTGRLLAPLLRSSGVWRLRGLAHPVIAFGLWGTGLYLWHLRPAYEAAVGHDVIHVLQHACLFALGANLWLALLGPLPKPAWFGNGARLGYVIAVWLWGAMLANAFVWASQPFYPHYPGTADQSAAGAVMLIEQGALIFGLLAWLLARALRDAGRRQDLAELAAAHGVVVDERRIARAVSAGEGDALARRLTEAAPR
jgi:cytochrome c oxidase assembly factor CtaG